MTVAGADTGADAGDTADQSVPAQGQALPPEPGHVGPRPQGHDGEPSKTIRAAKRRIHANRLRAGIATTIILLLIGGAAAGVAGSRHCGSITIGLCAQQACKPRTACFATEAQLEAWMKEMRRIGSMM